MANMRRKKLSIIIGSLILIAGIFNILWFGAIISRILDLKAIVRPTLVISPLPYIILGIGFGGNTVLASVITIVFIAGILLSLICGVIVLARRSSVLAWIGSAGALICVPLLGIAAIILTILSKRDFAGQ